MKVAMMLPTFTVEFGTTMAAARVADEGGLDGVFSFDHLWPMGNPGRPALWSFGVLAAVGAVTSHVAVGPLVARIDLLPEEELVRVFTTLAAIVGPERVVAAFGAGDRLSAAENDAYGLARAPVAERVAMMARVAGLVRRAGIETWIGGTSDAVAGLDADAHNLWGVTAEDVATYRARHGDIPLTWAGQVLIGRSSSEVATLLDRYRDRPGLVSGTPDEVAAWLRGLDVSWAVCAPLDYIDAPERSTETVCLVAEAVQ